VLDDTYVHDTLKAIRSSIAPWLPKSADRPAGPPEITCALQEAATTSSPSARELWAHAARLADAAAWLTDPHGETSREAWGRVRELCDRATTEENGS
jgi:hypothetical protein